MGHAATSDLRWVLADAVPQVATEGEVVRCRPLPLPPAAVRHAPWPVARRLAVAGGRQSGPVGLAHTARAPRHAGVSGHVLSCDGTQGVRRRRSRRPGVTVAL